MPPRHDDDSLDEEYDDSECAGRRGSGLARRSVPRCLPVLRPGGGRGADLCPKCGNFIGGSDDHTSTRLHAPWVIITAIVLLVAIAWVRSGGCGKPSGPGN